MTWLNSLWVAAEVFTTHDAHKRAHMTAHNNGQALVLEVRDVSAGAGGPFLVLAAAGAGRAWSW